MGQNCCLTPHRLGGKHRDHKSTQEGSQGNGDEAPGGLLLHPRDLLLRLVSQPHLQIDEQRRLLQEMVAQGGRFVLDHPLGLVDLSCLAPDHRPLDRLGVSNCQGLNFGEEFLPLPDSRQQFQARQGLLTLYVRPF